MIVLYDGFEPTIVRIVPTRISDGDEPHEIEATRVELSDGIYIIKHERANDTLLSTYSTMRCDLDILLS